MINLEDHIETIPYIKIEYSRYLEKLGIFTVRDLLLHFPRRYSNNSEVITIGDITNNPDEERAFQIQCFITNFKSIRIRGGKTLQTAVAEDHTGKVKCTWFNQPYLKNVFKSNNEFYLSGKVKVKGNQIDFYPSVYEEVKENKDSVHLNRITPEYNLTEGISKKWLRNRIKWIVDNIKDIQIKDELFKNNLIETPVSENLKQVHFPDTEGGFFNSIKQLSLYELTSINLKLLNQKESKKKNKPVPIGGKKELEPLLNDFIQNLPFQLTNDQEKTINKIFEKLNQKQLLDILIQGDVGSGKTIVAIAISLLISKSGYQSIILAPTTILAEQHYKSFKNTLDKFNLKIDLVTSKTKSSDKQKSDIIIGTTAILSRKKDLVENIGVIIVDEQHKFGVKQREDLVNEYSFLKEMKKTPHLINMSATPIPRSILQIFFDEIEVIRIKDKPKDRIEIKTYVVPTKKRQDSYKWIENKIIKEKTQVYWVCPLVSDSISGKPTVSAESKFKELKKIYGNKLSIGLLHGKLKEDEKLMILNDFKSHKIDILVSTTVIEVGVDVPNANIMIIEDAEKFGLSQLHQIRGRVGRGDKESFCFLFTGESISKHGIERLNFLATHSDGFQIAEFDLQNRGPGEIYGVVQSGIPNLKVADLSDITAIKKSKIIAKELYSKGIKNIQLFQ